LGRPKEFVRQGVLVIVYKNGPCGLDGIELERMDRLRNRKDVKREVDGRCIRHEDLLPIGDDGETMMHWTVFAPFGYRGFTGRPERACVLDEKSASEDEYD
jgi:hypothetical protein